MRDWGLVTSSARQESNLIPLMYRVSIQKHRWWCRCSIHAVRYGICLSPSKGFV